MNSAAHWAGRIARGGKSIYGAPLGILMLEARFPRIPGDMGNGETWPFPVLFRVVRGATPERVVPLAGQPGFAWTPGRQFLVDGERSPYCARGVLERMVERAAAAGIEVRAGYELEWFVGHAGESAGSPSSGCSRCTSIP